MTGAHTICTALVGRWHNSYDPGELVVALDGDEPGRKAANKLANRAVSAGWRVRVVNCPEKKDWNDMACEVAA